MPLARTALTALSLATSLLVAGCVGDEARTTAATDTPTSTGLSTYEPPPSPSPSPGTRITTGDIEFAGPRAGQRRSWPSVYHHSPSTAATPSGARVARLLAA
jgi:hypothetical protein